MSKYDCEKRIESDFASIAVGSPFNRWVLYM